MKELNIEIAVKIYDYEELDAADRELMDAAREATNPQLCPLLPLLGRSCSQTGKRYCSDRHQPGKRRLSFRAVCRTHHPILCQLPTSRPGSNHPRHCRTQRARRVPGVSHPALRRLPASDARNGEALQAANAGVAVWQKGNLRAEECGRITATLVRCFGHEVTEPIKY